MKTACLSVILLFHATLQLQCDKPKITAHIGGEFVLTCKYDTKTFWFSKKYWCRGESRSTCDILADSDRVKTTGECYVIDAGRAGLFVKVTNLKFEDAGVYWVGIDKIYSDVMTSINVVITEVPVSKPRLWSLSSLVDRPTCWGKPVTVRCGCTKGTAIRYAWYQRTDHKDVQLHRSSDLSLYCGTVQKGGNYYCVASNDISSEESAIISVQVLVPADSGCIYVVQMQGQPVYDCVDRMSNTTTETPPLPTCQATREIHTETRVHQNVTFLHRVWTGVPLWYTLLRWTSFASLLITLCIVLICSKRRHNKHVKMRKRWRIMKCHLTQMPQSV